jgi:hypothetical protein
MYLGCPGRGDQPRRANSRLGYGPGTVSDSKPILIRLTRTDGVKISRHGSRGDGPWPVYRPANGGAHRTFVVECRHKQKSGKQRPDSSLHRSWSSFLEMWGR